VHYYKKQNFKASYLHTEGRNINLSTLIEDNDAISKSNTKWCFT